MKSVLVIGSNGNLGQFITENLRNVSDRLQLVRVEKCTLDKALNPTNTSEKIHFGDLTDRDFVQSVLSMYENSTVIHCAARWNGLNRDSTILSNSRSMTYNSLKTGS